MAYVKTCHRSNGCKVRANKERIHLQPPSFVFSMGCLPMGERVSQMKLLFKVDPNQSYQTKYSYHFLSDNSSNRNS